MQQLHRGILAILYTCTIVAILVTVWLGWQYYTLPLAERPHSTMYETWKPGGFIGHGLGVIGSLLMIFLLGYVLRKRLRFMRNWGNIRTWLNYHIWMGITGPLLVLFHTSFKFGGIVAVSFWSMTAVALSGVLGRYLYLQIPRTRSGAEIGRKELEDQERSYWIKLQAMQGMDDSTIETIRSFIESGQTEGNSTSWTALPGLMLSDSTRPFKRMSLRKTLKTETQLSPGEIGEVMALAESQERLSHRIAFLDAAQAMLHHWHIIHRPFAAVMFLIMFVHIIVAVLFGYRWVF